MQALLPAGVSTVRGVHFADCGACQTVRYGGKYKLAPGRSKFTAKTSHFHFLSFRFFFFSNSLKVLIWLYMLSEFHISNQWSLKPKKKTKNEKTVMLMGGWKIKAVPERFYFFYFFWMTAADISTDSKPTLLGNLTAPSHHFSKMTSLNWTTFATEMQSGMIEWYAACFSRL